MKTIRWWFKALSIIPKISKEEWDQLDVVTKWLIMTRSAVTTVTVFSAIVAGLFAWRNDSFHWGLWLIMTVGLFLAHGTNNILNDYTDYNRGVDTDNYFRAMYGPHPLVHGFHDKKTQLRYFVVSGVLALSAGLYTYYATGFDVRVLALIALGSVFLLFYTYPLKHFAIGELSIFAIWGPIMIGGVYYVLARQVDWNVILASIPIGLSVMSINLGKHIDKMEEDRQLRVRTLPVVIGQTAARYMDLIALALTYILIVFQIITRFYTPVMLVVFLAAKPALLALAVLAKPRPAAPPENYPAWPIWFAGFTFMHNRRFIMFFMAGLVVDTLLRVYLPAFWSI